MIDLNIAHQRLYNQYIAGGTCEQPEELVKWMVAVQAQDYAAAQWALGLRLQGATSEKLEQAFTAGSLLRTHVMRPTWHFVSPADIRWLLALTAPRIKALSAYWYRKLELDDAVFQCSNAVLVKALQGGKQLTRLELLSVFKQAGIAAEDEGRLTYIMMRAELDGVVCSGGRQGKQFTYTLLDERVPAVRTIERDEALAEFVRRYFTSHGPATLQDFGWWSGLTMADARAGLAMVRSHLVGEVIDGQTYWSASSTYIPSVAEHERIAYLLPNYDEYVVGYRDRSAIFDEQHTQVLDVRGNILFNHTMVLDGQVVGTWKRTLKKDTVLLTVSPFVPLSRADTQRFIIVAERYAAFWERSVNYIQTSV